MIFMSVSCTYPAGGKFSRSRQLASINSKYATFNYTASRQSLDVHAPQDSAIPFQVPLTGAFSEQRLTSAETKHDMYSRTHNWLAPHSFPDKCRVRGRTPMILKAQRGQTGYQGAHMKGSSPRVDGTVTRTRFTAVQTCFTHVTRNRDHLEAHT